MNKENILLSSKTIELSETKTYLELLNRVCFYDFPNLNGVELPSDTALERAQSLVDMPVKAKYTVNSKGEPTFKGHEAYIDKDGELAFDTENIGVHTAVYIQDDDVEIKGEVKHLPCLFSRQKIWTRNKNVVAACKRLFTEGELHNSWEIVSDKYEFDNGVKRLLDYVFEANTFLGYDVGVEPAYGNSAKVLSLSSDNAMSELLVAEALSKDMVEGNFIKKESEDKKMDDKKKQDDENLKKITEDKPDKMVVDTPPVEEPSDDEENAKKRKKCGSSDEKSDVEKLNTTIEVLNKTISEKNEAIITMGIEISNLKNEISALATFKEAYDEAEKKKAKLEKSQKISDLTQYVKDANAFSNDEIAADEIKNLISELNKSKLQEMIADRLVSNLRDKNKKQETASIKKENVKSDTVDVNDINYKSVMAEFLR